jgi:excinuclease ABC subunit A
MPASDIIIKGAREHNLRDVDLVLPRNQLICLTGVSGSGKSSLAFDTLYAEGQRRYVESLSTFARQFLGQMPKPDVDYIGGLSPSISISQKSAGNNPRSTVGTVTEIHDYLRVLYARVGTGHCPKCGRPITAQSREQILVGILQLEPGTKFSVLAPLIRQQKGEYRDLFEDLLKQGFARARVDGAVISMNDPPKLDRQLRHDVEVVIDRLVVKDDVRPRLAEAVELALKLGEGSLVIEVEEPEEVAAARGKATRDVVFSSAYACTPCGLSFEPPSPQLFSFNSPQGMCKTCGGLGTMFSFVPDRLVPNPRHSFKDGCVELIGPWKDLGRWRRHIYQGMADTMERKLGVEEGTLLETPWEKLEPSQQRLIMWGTGDEHITFTWRGGATPVKYGGRYTGVIPELLERHRTAKSKPLIASLEKYMSNAECSDCGGRRLAPQGSAVTIESLHPRFADRPRRSLPDICDLTPPAPRSPRKCSRRSARDSASL